MSPERRQYHKDRISQTKPRSPEEQAAYEDFRNENLMPDTDEHRVVNLSRAKQAGNVTLAADAREAVLPERPLLAAPEAHVAHIAVSQATDQDGPVAVHLG